MPVAVTVPLVAKLPPVTVPVAVTVPLVAKLPPVTSPVALMSPAVYKSAPVTVPVALTAPPVYKLPPVTSPLTLKLVKTPTFCKLELTTLDANVVPVKLFASTELAVTPVKKAPLPR